MSHTALLTATYRMALKAFPNEELSALNNGIQAGFLETENIAYELSVKANVINADGRASDLASLLAAAAAEVIARVNSGSFDA